MAACQLTDKPSSHIYSGVYCVTFISGSSRGYNEYYILRVSHLDNDAPRLSHPDWVPFVEYLGHLMSLSHLDK
jgi:hypothetical protein